jgi:2,4-dienoyl-CoA reductase-like NADH-dependent reductase (Old Yellow Enzyme family)
LGSRAIGGAGLIISEACSGISRRSYHLLPTWAFIVMSTLLKLKEITDFIHLSMAL